MNAVIIGRFQPFHLGHLSILEETAKKADRILIIIGSSDGPRTIRNPWTFSERMDMIIKSTSHIKVPIVIKPSYDWIYDDSTWTSEIGCIVNDVFGHHKQYEISLVGFAKDFTSNYLNQFPQWKQISVKPLLDQDSQRTLDATRIRDILFETGSILKISTYIPYGTLVVLIKVKQAIIDLKLEYQFVKQYKESWKNTPYPPIFVTVDAIVVQSGHILLVERGEYPGKGLLAMPGGFLGQNETLEDCVIRELREETRLKIPEKVLRGSIKGREVFDSPTRSTRGRTITTAFIFKLDDSRQLPKVQGGDDAKFAKWIPISEFKQSRQYFYEDHFHIINKMLKNI